LLRAVFYLAEGANLGVEVIGGHNILGVAPAYQNFRYRHDQNLEICPHYCMNDLDSETPLPFRDSTKIRGIRLQSVPSSYLV